MNGRFDLAAVFGLLAVIGTIGPFADDYWIAFGFGICVAIALAQSWALFSSLSGYVSLGHVVFYGIGAYVVVATWNTLPLWVSLPAAALAAGAFAFAIALPVLRVRGPYFVILTFGVAELVKYSLVIVDSAAGHASRVIIGAPEPIILFYIVLSLAAIATLISYLVRNARLGWGLRAIREDEFAAETTGVPVLRYKVIAVVLSALIPGIIGGVAVLRATYFEPRVAFDPMISFSMIATTIIGGSDELVGPVLGAVALTALSEVLWANAPLIYPIILGILLIIFVRFMPKGLAPLLRPLG
jgi:branched-chain amino acid transport system permease protein